MEIQVSLAIRRNNVLLILNHKFLKNEKKIDNARIELQSNTANDRNVQKLGPFWVPNNKSKIFMVITNKFCRVPECSL